MSWREIELGEGVEVKHGFAFKGEFFSNVGEKIVLTPGNFNEKGGFRRRVEKDRYYSGDIPETYILDQGDLIIALTEQGAGLLGSSAWIPESGKYLHNQRLGLVSVVDENLLHKKYLYHLFNTYLVRGQISGSASGTKVRHTSPNRIYKVKVNIPEVKVQEKISGIIDSYDDLIENNRRRIQLLEGSARLLYKEWFVNFRFPGHENVKIIDGIPEGWVKKNLFEVSQVTYGFSFKAKLFSNDSVGVPVVRIRDIPKRTSKTFTVEDAPKEKLLKDGDFLIGMDGDFHMNYWCGGKAWLNQRVVRILGDSGISTGFIRQAIEEPICDFNRLITGTTVRHLGAKHLKMIDIFFPENNILIEANNYFENIRNSVVVFEQEIKKLKEARDLLLPRLMSGELSV